MAAKPQQVHGARSTASVSRTVSAGPTDAAQLDILRRTLRSLSENAPPAMFEELSRAAAELGSAALVEDIGRARDIAGQVVHHRVREAELTALFDTARDIARLRETESLLRGVAQRARQIAASDLAYISSIEDHAEQFVVRATEGCISRDFESMRVPRRHGMCGQVLRTRRPCISVDYLSDQGFNRHPRIDAIVREEGITSLLGVPLEIDRRVIGVLFVGHRTRHPYAPNDVAVLASLAALAAIAIHGARLFEETKRALAGERAANDSLNDRAAELNAAGEAHERIIELLVGDGSLGDLVVRMSQLLSCRAAVVDSRRQILAAAGSLPALSADGPLDEAIRDSTVSGRSAMRQAPDGTVCRVAPILGGTARLGALAIWRESDLSGSETRTLERGAVVAAIMQMAGERLNEAANRDTHDTLAALLQRADEFLADRYVGARLKNDGLPWPLTLHLIDLDGMRPSQVAAAARPLVTRHGGIAAEYQAGFVVLVGPRAGPGFAQELQAALEDETGVTPNIAVAEVANSAANLPDRHRSAQWTLQILRKLGHRGQIGHERLFAAYAPLFRDKTRDEVQVFVLAAIGSLTKYDRDHTTRLADTLLLYLDFGQKLQATADALGIHVNTARQRLATIKAMCPGWDAPGRLLETHLALRLHAICGQLL